MLGALGRKKISLPPHAGICVCALNWVFFLATSNYLLPARAPPVTLPRSAVFCFIYWASVVCQVLPTKLIPQFLYAWKTPTLTTSPSSNGGSFWQTFLGHLYTALQSKASFAAPSGLLFMAALVTLVRVFSKVHTSENLTGHDGSGNT